MSDKNNTTIDSFEVALYDLFCSENKEIKVDAVRIPMIQRDYAQGRPDKVDLRKKFLDTLYAAIDDSNAKPCVLDFIYGQRYRAIQPEETIFEPIDGQQRLTTLFLLHLYVAKQVEAHETGFDDYKWLAGFSYQTRQSSKRFCKELVEMPAEAFNNLKSYLNTTPWYTRRYKSDPTIAGMIQTLSDIAGHYKFRHEDSGYMKQVWERLKTNITFMLLYLKDLQTTDDLYIKMNSRGLFLTQFEQFKAELEGYFKDIKNTQELNFGVKIDTLWTNLLWDYRNKKQDGINADFKTYDSSNLSPYAKNGLDEKFHHLFRRFMTMEGFKCDLFYEYAEEDEKPELREYKDNPNENLLSLAKIVFKNVPIEEKEKRMLRLCRFLDGVSLVSLNLC